MADHNMKEEISALMDGEIDEQKMQQYLRELRTDSECRSCWEQYHLIGDTLRNNLPLHMNRSFVDGISKAIAEEDLPAPVTTPQETQAPKTKRHAMINPFSGFAIAASVAAVAYLGVGMITVEEAAGPSLANNTSAVAPVAPIAQNLPQTLPQSGVQTVQGQQWTITKPAVESRLNNYLYNHRNVAGSTAINPVVVPHARLVVNQSPRGE